MRFTRFFDIILQARMQDWQIAVLNSENLHTRRMTRSRFLKLDRKLSQLSFYNIIYQYRMRETGFTESRRWSTEDGGEAAV